jgi:hypothetical protein
MKLSQYLRTIVNNKVILLIKKDSCKICGSTENLEVHHSNSSIGHRFISWQNPPSKNQYPLI